MFFSRSLVLIVIAVCFLPFGLDALFEGQSMDEVLTEIGPPNGKRISSNRELWVYSGDITLEFIEGRLKRAKGTVMEPAPQALEPAMVAEVPESEPVDQPIEPEPVADLPAGRPDTSTLDNEIQQLSEGLPELPQDLGGISQEEEELSEVPDSGSFLFSLLAWAIPVFLVFIFLKIAVRIVGVEAASSALLFIAVADQAVTHGVQWLFLSVLGFPTALHADSLAAFLVMLILVNKMTYAKQLPVAIKVVIISKVAAIVTAYLLFLVLLHNL